MTATDFIDDLSETERDVVRDNWTKIGYVYWFTADMVEYWRNNATGHVAEMVTY